MQNKPAFISTPARMITMEYNSEAPLSSIELEALDKYKELHTQFQPLLNEWKTLESDYQAAIKPQRQLRHELFSLEEDVKLYRHLAGFTEEEIAEMPEQEEDLELEPNKLHEEAEEFKIKYEAHYDKVQGLINRFKKVNDLTDTMKELYEDFNENYFSYIMENHENMEIDVVRFDEDYNEFNILMDELTDHIYGAADEHKALIAAYNELVTAMDDTFKRIDIISEEVDKLRADNAGGGGNHELN